MDYNCHISWWIFSRLVLMQTGVSTLQSTEKLQNYFTLTVSRFV